MCLDVLGAHLSERAVSKLNFTEQAISVEPLFLLVVLSIACLKIYKVFCCFSLVRKVWGVKFDSDITTRAQLKQASFCHLWALGSYALLLPLTLSFAAVVLGKRPPAGPDSLGLFLLFICHISIVADAYLLRRCCVSFLFLEPNSSLRCIHCGRGKKDLVI